jgi:hypothetical protein
VSCTIACILCRRSDGVTVSPPFPAGVAARPAALVVAFMAVPCLSIHGGGTSTTNTSPAPEGYLHATFASKN